MNKNQYISLASLLWILIWIFSFKVFIYGWFVIGLLGIIYILHVDTGSMKWYKKLDELKVKHIIAVLCGPLTLIFRFIILPIWRPSAK